MFPSSDQPQQEVPITPQQQATSSTAPAMGTPVAQVRDRDSTPYSQPEPYPGESDLLTGFE